MGATIRSVTTGILGVAFIQSILAGIGFLVVGLPGAGLWAVMFLIAAVLQVGVLVLIPAVVYVFAVSSFLIRRRTLVDPRKEELITHGQHNCTNEQPDNSQADESSDSTEKNNDNRYRDAPAQ